MITPKISGLLFSLGLGLTILLAACTNPGSGGGGDTDASDGDKDSENSSSSIAGSPTGCGAIASGTYKNPVTASDGVPVRFISAAGPNLVIVQSEVSDPFLVRIHGLSNTVGSSTGLAESQITSFSANGLFYVPAGDSCQETTASGVAQIGSLFNSAGDGLSERLASTGTVIPATTDSCDGSRIGTCLAALAETPPETATADELVRFLWKPESDSDGRLAVHTSPYRTTVKVNGEIGINQGPGNGYGSLARFSKSGCSYGNAKIQVFNSSGLPYTVGGKTTFSVPNGCNRHCVEGGNGQVVACSK